MIRQRTHGKKPERKSKHRALKNTVEEYLQEYFEKKDNNNNNNNDNDNEGVLVSQNEWTLNFKLQDITESAGVTVTQGTGASAVTGTLKTALDGETSKAVIATAPGTHCSNFCSLPSFILHKHFSSLFHRLLLFLFLFCS